MYILGGLSHINALLHRNTLGEVAGEVHVNAVRCSEVVGEKLQWHDSQEALQAVDRKRDADSTRVIGDIVVVFVTNDDRAAIPCRDLAQGSLHFRVQRVLGHDEDHGHGFVNES